MPILTQNRLNQQAAKFLQHLGRDQNVINEFKTKGGYCQGYSVLYAYSRWVSAKKRRHRSKNKPKTDDYRWFQKMSRELANWSPEKKLSQSRMQELERFIGLIRFHQTPHDFLRYQGYQTDLAAYFEELKQEYTVTAAFSVKSLAYALKHIIHNDKIIMLGSESHATSVFKHRGRIYFYDSNGELGQVRAFAWLSLARKIIASYPGDRKHKLTPINIKVFDSGAPATYPAPEALLEKIYQRNQYGMYSTKEVVGLAAGQNDLTALRFYLDQGMHPNEPTGKIGLTPLMRAVYSQYDDIVDALLAEGIDVDVSKAHGSALHFAVKHGNETAVQKLIQAGCDVNLRDVAGISPLMKAIWKGNHKILDDLLFAGARFDKDDKLTMTIHRLCHSNQPQQLMEFIAKQGKFDLSKPQFQYAIADTLASGMPEATYALIDHGQKPLTPVQANAIVNLSEAYLKQSATNEVKAFIQQHERVNQTIEQWSNNNQFFRNSYRQMWYDTQPTQSVKRIMQDYFDPKKAKYHIRRKYQTATKEIAQFCDSNPKPEALLQKLYQMERAHAAALMNKKKDVLKNHGAYRRRLHFCIARLEALYPEHKLQHNGTIYRK